MNDAVAYVRVSTDEQAREGVSLDAQVARLQAYCTMTGLTVVKMIREEGVSARLALSHRPGGRELLSLIRARKAQHVVSLKLDRLFRDAEDALHQTREWDQANIALHLVDMGGQSLNTASAIGRLFLTMTAAFAELERNMCAERTKAALAHKKSMRQAYGTTPLGYQRVEDTLVPDPEEMETVTTIRRMYDEGNSLRSIANSLNSQGIPSKNGGRWYASTVRYVLRNDLYAAMPLQSGR